MRADLLAERVREAPDLPGVYVFSEDAGTRLYVGKAQSLRARLRSYATRPELLDPKTQAMLARAGQVHWTVTDNPREALLLESSLIKKYRPPYNVRLRDDKQYPYLCLTFSEDYPKLVVTRTRKDDGNAYFGPYTDVKAMRRVKKLAERLFFIRDCGNRFRAGPEERPCLSYHIKQCLAPCALYIGKEEYRSFARDAAKFLEGRSEEVLRQMRQQMEEASQGLDFERAARLRDQISAISRSLEPQKVAGSTRADTDVIGVALRGAVGAATVLLMREGRLLGEETALLEGTLDESAEAVLGAFVRQFYSGRPAIPRHILVARIPKDAGALELELSSLAKRGVRFSAPTRGKGRDLVGLAEKNAEVYLEAYVSRELSDTKSAKAGLEELRDTLGLRNPPARIECYDVSNTQGSEVVASMVVMVNGKPAPKEYRHFRIRSVSGLPDDFQSMREVLTRRLSRLGQGADRMGLPPDLVVVDGGAGQVSAAQEAFEVAGVTFPLIGLAKANELVFIPGVSEPLELSRSSEALKLLQRIRDEAHRFALTYHRKLRGRKAVRSILEEVSGVGRERRKALLRHFGTLKRLREATIEELREVPTMTNAVAIKLYNYLRGGDSREDGVKKQ